MKKTYYLYHIPSKKIGVTRNLNKRVTQQQGYKPGEYEVLESSTDINYISKKEIELQKSFGYRKDTKLYKNLFKMKINVTEQTTTFPVHLTALKEALNNEPNLTWTTEFGKIALCPKLINWITINAIRGPNITLHKDNIIESLKENLNLVNAIPSDINTKKIVA